MEKRTLLFIGLGLLFIVTTCLQNVTSNSDIPKMTKEELRSMLGNPALIFLDVRSKEDWGKSDLKIKGAVREDPEKDIKLWPVEVKRPNKSFYRKNSSQKGLRPAEQDKMISLIQ